MLGEGQRSTGREVVALVTAAVSADVRTVDELARACDYPASVAVTLGRFLAAVLNRAAGRSREAPEDVLTWVGRELTRGAATSAELVALEVGRRSLDGYEPTDSELEEWRTPEVLSALANLAAGALEHYHHLGGVPPEWMLQSMGLTFAT